MNNLSWATSALSSFEHKYKYHLQCNRMLLYAKDDLKQLTTEGMQHQAKRKQASKQAKKMYVSSLKTAFCVYTFKFQPIFNNYSYAKSHMN